MRKQLVDSWYEGRKRSDGDSALLKINHLHLGEIPRTFSLSKQFMCKKQLIVSLEIHMAKKVDSNLKIDKLFPSKIIKTEVSVHLMNAKCRNMMAKRSFSLCSSHSSILFQRSLLSLRKSNYH